MSPVYNSRAKTGQNGFTLLELIIVLVIILMLMAIPIMGSSLLPSVRFYQAENRLLDDIRTLRVKAQMSGTTQRLVLNSTQDGYYYSGSQTHRRYDHYSVAIEGVIRFYPNGGADDGIVRLYDAERFAAVRVNGITGAISRGKDEKN